MTILITLIIFLFFISIRNERLYKFRIRLLQNDYKTYKKLPSYDKMYWLFWIPLKLKYWVKE